MPTNHPEFANIIRSNVISALAEDLGGGDLTAQLIPEKITGHATVITRQHAVLCGKAWFDACFKILDPHSTVTWFVRDGSKIAPNEKICEIHGNARALLTAERTALNFLQTLSATATLTQQYVDAIKGLPAKIMDTRKTIPNLRMAQKYAVRIGGGYNQRIGLFDGILIKENHIIAAGGISEAIKQAFLLAPEDATVQIEVENIKQLSEALDAGAKLILLDNFDLDGMRDAVKFTAHRADLEASGGVNIKTVRPIAETGVDRISIGTLTKDVNAVDLSLRFL
jgi:nicotinate-nucleotide pyrophosphorylase (carboxylating)